MVWSRMIKILLWLCVVVSAFAEPCLVVSVHDGDTLRVRCGDGSFRTVRLADVDAPEVGQRFGDFAALTLRALVGGRVVGVMGATVDRYGRWVARVECDGRDVSAVMIERGAAWWYRAYSRRGDLAIVEAAAKKDRRGLWVQSAPVAPWEWRRGVRR